MYSVGDRNPLFGQLLNRFRWRLLLENCGGNTEEDMSRTFEICIEDLETDFQISKFSNNPPWQE